MHSCTTYDGTLEEYVYLDGNINGEILHFAERNAGIVTQDNSGTILLGLGRLNGLHTKTDAALLVYFQYFDLDHLAFF